MTDPRTPPGSFLVTNDNVEMIELSSRINAGDAEQDGRAIKLMAISGKGLPEYMLGEGAHSTKATASTQELPALVGFAFFQSVAVWYIWHPILTQVIQNAVDAGLCPETVTAVGSNGKAIQEHGLFSVDDVKKHTKAASSCGSCAGLVEQILINTVGGAADVKPKSEKAICGCSDLNHGQIRQAIRDQHLLTIAGTMSYLNWRTPNGCATCRPALNYYLISTWPGEAKDDPQSRLINERAHANIQKDGTYSVVPRMWGGVTNPSELRRIADVADKYNVPMVKVTGGQRIDLLGIRKQDLPGVWKDLDMPSGHAYGKSIRTVKTCVGSEFCRFGTQNSTQLGIELEHDLFNMWSPHKVKLAVSGCPRNCSEAGIKDIGIIGVDSGWEMYIGGNGGIKTEVAEFFVKLKTAEEVREYNGAFLQLYREEAFYLERTVHYLQRVGMEHIKKAVLEDPERRKALNDRLQFSLSFEQDPWKERLEQPLLKKEFEVIPVKNLEVSV